MHFYTNDVVATSKIPILSPRVRFPVGVFFLPLCPYTPPLPPEPKRGPTSTLVWLERQPTLVAVTVRVWVACATSGADRIPPSYGPPNRDDNNVFFLARSRSDAGSRRWRHKGLLLQSTTVLARTRRFLDSRACKPKVGLRTPLTAHSSAIAPEREREQMAALAERRDRMAALARREHERAARSLPAAALFAVCA